MELAVTVYRFKWAYEKSPTYGIPLLTYEVDKWEFRMWGFSVGRFKCYSVLVSKKRTAYDAGVQLNNPHTNSKARFESNKLCQKMGDLPLFKSN